MGDWLGFELRRLDGMHVTYYEVNESFYQMNQVLFVLTWTLKANSIMLHGYFLL